jgi:hypothetical protein
MRNCMLAAVIRLGISKMDFMILLFFIYGQKLPRNQGWTTQLNDRILKFFVQTIVFVLRSNGE